MKILPRTSLTIIKQNLQNLWIPFQKGQGANNYPQITPLDNRIHIDTWNRRQERKPIEISGRFLQTKFCGKRHKVPQATSEPPPKMSEMKQFGGTLKKGLDPLIFSQKDTADKPARANIEVSRPHKLWKKPRAECQPCWSQKEFTVGWSASPTNPDKGSARKRKKKYSDRPRDASTDYWQVHEWMALVDTWIGV